MRKGKAETIPGSARSVTERQSWSKTMSSQRSLLLGAVGVLAAVAVLAVSERSGYAQSAAFGDAAGSAARAGGAVSVVPFANVSARPEDDWLGIGIAETVLSGVERLGFLTVVDRQSLFGAAGGDRGDAKALGDETWARDRALAAGVSWLVGGGFQRLDDRVRIIARVTDVETGAPREFARVDGHADDLFLLQDRIVAEVADGLARLVRPGAASPPDARTSVAREPEGQGIPDPSGARGGRESGGRSVAARSRVPFDANAATPAVAGVGVRGGGESGGASVAARSRDSFDANATTPLAGAVRARGGGESGYAPVAAGSRVPFDANAATPEDAPAGFATAAPAGDAGVLTGRVTVRPRRTTTPPTVDGLLDDAVWSNAARITEFVQREPQDGAPATEDTDVYLAYDESNLYLAFHAKYEEPRIMRANRVDRDRADFGDDTISVYFDTFLDQQRAYVFSVNGYGVQGDSIVGGRGRGGGGGGGGGGFSGGGRGGVPRGDRSWDALFTSGGQPVADGYTAEMAIPFKSLRYPARPGDAPHTWGFQIVRRIRGKDETIVWSPVSRDVAGFLPQMGVLDGMSGLSTSRNLEVQPTFTAFRYGTFDEGAGQLVDGDPQPDFGANFKYGVTPNLIADFTLNPDFSQIESDRPQVEVNQRFALFYPELRPFFLEGAEIFQIQAPVTVVHTRTIVDPQYGAKLTGKAGKTTLGVLFANDEGASLGVDDRLDPAFGQSAQTFVGRARYDLYSESFIGAVVTDREFVDGYSRLVGADSNFRIGATHQLGFRAFGTDRRLSQSGPQTNPCPTTATSDPEIPASCGGYAYDFGFRKRGRNLSYSIDSFALSPDFRTDVGFVRRTDQRETEAQLEYEWWPQTWVISWGPEVRYGRNYNFDQVLEDETFRARVSANFAKNIRYSFDVDQDMERYYGFDFDKRRYGMFGNVNTNRVLTFGGGFNWGDEVYFEGANAFLGRESGFRTFINFRPVSRFATNINITTSRFTDPLGLFTAGVNDGERKEDGEIFNVNIFRALNTYQVTDRLALRNITELNTWDGKIALNFLATYRVNSGTAFYIGYDDHYQQHHRFYDDQVNIIDRGYLQTNRAVFTKIQYLFRY